MVRNLSKKIAHTALIIVVFIAGALPAVAWTGATASPPGANTSAPINVSSTAQTKTGYFNLSLPSSDNTWGINVSGGQYGIYGSGISGTGVEGVSGTGWGGFFAGNTYGLYAANNSGYYAELVNGSYGLYTNGYINAPNSYGGAFQLTNGGGCYIGNWFTGGCSCPGWSPVARYAYYMDTNSTYGGGRGYLCDG